MAGTSTPEEQSAYEGLSASHQAFVDAYLANGMIAWKAYRDAVYTGREGSYTYLSTAGSRLMKNDDVRRAISERMKEGAMSAEEALYRLGEQGRAPADEFIVFERRQVQEPVWVPVAVAIEERRLEIEVERETQRRLGQDGDKAADEVLARLEQELVRLEVIQERDPDRMVKIEGPVREVVDERIDLERMARAGKLHLIKSIKKDKDGSTKVELYDAQSALKLIGQAHGVFTDRLDIRVTEPIRVIDFSPAEDEEGDGDG